MALLDSESSSSSDFNNKAPDMQTLESQSIETHATTITKSGIATVTKVKATIKTTIKLKSKEKKRKADENSESERPSQKKARNTAKKTSNMLETAARTIGTKINVGAHVSMAKGLKYSSFYSRKKEILMFGLREKTGVQNAITNNQKIGGNAFALFLKSQRKWTSPDMKESDAVAFRDGCKKAGIDPKRFVRFPISISP